MLKPLEDRDILGISVRPVGFGEALCNYDILLERGEHSVVNFLNANNANIAQKNPAYREALRRSEVLPDGIGVDIAAKIMNGELFPANLNGTDMIPALFVYIQRPLTVALIGADRKALDHAVENFAALTPWHRFVAVADGYFDQSKSDEVLKELAALKPDVTLVAMGSPKQEIWIDEHMGAEHGTLIFGVGALFDFISGRVPRAPQLLRELRLEWVFRLAIEPSRMWRRYILGNPLFLYRVLRYKWSGARIAQPPLA